MYDIWWDICMTRVITPALPLQLSRLTFSAERKRCFTLELCAGLGFMHTRYWIHVKCKPCFEFWIHCSTMNTSCGQNLGGKFKILLTLTSEFVATSILLQIMARYICRLPMLGSVLVSLGMSYFCTHTEDSSVHSGGCKPAPLVGCGGWLEYFVADGICWGGWGVT